MRDRMGGRSGSAMRISRRDHCHLRVRIGDAVYPVGCPGKVYRVLVVHGQVIVRGLGVCRPSLEPSTHAVQSQRPPRPAPAVRHSQ